MTVYASLRDRKPTQHFINGQQTFSTRPACASGASGDDGARRTGTMAEEMTVHRANLVRVQTDLPDEHLALSGCGATSGVGAALWSARVMPGATVAVFGIGLTIDDVNVAFDRMVRGEGIRTVLVPTDLTAVVTDGTTGAGRTRHVHG